VRQIVRNLIDDALDRIGTALRPRDNAFQRREITEMIQSADGCVLCALTERSVARYLDILAYEFVNDIPTRDQLRTSRGFCTQHAWQLLEQVRDPMGIGIIYRDVVNDVVKTLERYVSAHRPTSPRLGAEARDARIVAAKLRPRRTCIACDQARMTDLDNLHAVGRYLAEPAFASLYTQSTGVCLWHARRLLERTRAKDAAAVVRQTHAQWLEQLALAKKNEAAVGALATAIAGSSGARPRRSVTWDRIDSASTGAGRSQRATLAFPVGLPVAGPPRLALPGDGPSWLPYLDCPVCNALRETSVPPDGQHDSADLILLCPHHARGRLTTALKLGPSGDRSDSAARVEMLLRISSDWGDRRTSPRGNHEGLCPDCLRRAEQSEALIEGAFSAGNHASLSSVCLPHLYQALIVAAPASARSEVIATRAATWRALVDQLLEFIRKLDYRFRSEPRGDEQLAPRLAIPQMVGHDRFG
jgi:hypothetical protein